MKLVAIAMAALAALASESVAAEGSAPAGAVACATPGAVWNYTDAVEQQNRETLRQLMKFDCHDISGKSYALLEEHNGSAKILVFRKPGDWETAQVFYTLTDMLQIE